MKVPRRLPFLVFTVHAAVAALCTWIETFQWGMYPLAVDAGRFLRVLDAAVLWPIDGALRAITGVPGVWPFGIRWTVVILETAAHSLFGGLFWVLVAHGATVALASTRDGSGARG